MTLMQLEQMHDECFDRWFTGAPMCAECDALLRAADATGEER